MSIANILDWIVEHWGEIGTFLTLILGLIKRKRDINFIREELTKRGMKQEDIDEIV